MTEIDAIQLSGLSKTFVTRKGRAVTALDNVNLSIAEGEFVTVLGPSGCGKSTILNILARITEPTSGTALIRGAEPSAAKYDIGYVFQQDTVLPWRNVAENIELALVIRGTPRQDRDRRVAKLVRLTGLQGFEQAFPAELSGGMRKRVALAAAFAHDPAILLMDEPFGALDAQTRLLLQEELMRMWQETGKTVVFVTHDIPEAIFLADRVVVMTARPAKVKALRTVPLPRPRKLDALPFDPAYQTLFKELTGDLRPEVIMQNLETA